jgi:hypothetical protein
MRDLLLQAKGQFRQANSTGSLLLIQLVAEDCLIPGWIMFPF